MHDKAVENIRFSQEVRGMGAVGSDRIAPRHGCGQPPERSIAPTKTIAFSRKVRWGHADAVSTDTASADHRISAGFIVNSVTKYRRGDGTAKSGLTKASRSCKFCGRANGPRMDSKPAHAIPREVRSTVERWRKFRRSAVPACAQTLS